MTIRAYNRGGEGPASIEVFAFTDEVGKLNSFLLLFFCVCKVAELNIRRLQSYLTKCMVPKTFCSIFSQPFIIAKHD